MLPYRDMLDTRSAIVTALLGYAVHRAAVMYTPHMVFVPTPKFLSLNTKAVIDNTQTNVWLHSNKTINGHWNLCLVLFAHAPKYCYSFIFFQPLKNVEAILNIHSIWKQVVGHSLQISD